VPHLESWSVHEWKHPFADAVLQPIFMVERIGQGVTGCGWEHPFANLVAQSILTGELQGWGMSVHGREPRYPDFSESRRWIDGGSSKVSYPGPIPKGSPGLCC